MKKGFFYMLLVPFLAFSMNSCTPEDNSGDNNGGNGGGSNNNYHNGHEFVDLGLPSGTLWATCNVGAGTPEDYGRYFAYGEIDYKNNYTWEVYKYGWKDGSATNNYKIYKYNMNPLYGDVDNLTVLELSDDAASVKWGGNWRIPTREECSELLSYCLYEPATQNDVKGLRLTGSNGNSIFLPSAGFYKEQQIMDKDIQGYYRTSSLWCNPNSSDGSRCAYALQFHSEHAQMYSPGSRPCGYPIRPVFTK